MKMQITKRKEKILEAKKKILACRSGRLKTASIYLQAASRDILKIENIVKTLLEAELTEEYIRFLSVAGQLELCKNNVSSALDELLRIKEMLDNRLRGLSLITNETRMIINCDGCAKEIENDETFYALSTEFNPRVPIDEIEKSRFCSDCLIKGVKKMSLKEFESVGDRRFLYIKALVADYKK